jgi:uncharacterized membrane protein
LLRSLIGQSRANVPRKNLPLIKKLAEAHLKGKITEPQFNEQLRQLLQLPKQQKEKESISKEAKAAAELSNAFAAGKITEGEFRRKIAELIVRERLTSRRQVK